MFIQTDPRWSNVPIVRGITIGKEGCLLVCLYNANILLGNSINPEQLTKELTETGGFTQNGDLLWVKLRNTSSILWMFTGQGK
ncbi:MAG: hypothetical protein ABIB98_03865, partial [bacterium]